jgi:hypothetical protein
MWNDDFWNQDSELEIEQESPDRDQERLDSEQEKLDN